MVNSCSLKRKMKNWRLKRIWKKQWMKGNSSLDYLVIMQMKSIYCSTISRKRQTCSFSCQKISKMVQRWRNLGSVSRRRPIFGKIPQRPSINFWLMQILGIKVKSKVCFKPKRNLLKLTTHTDFRIWLRSIRKISSPKQWRNLKSLRKSTWTTSGKVVLLSLLKNFIEILKVEILS